MKNTFAVTMTLLLALTLGGSLTGYRMATTPHEAEKAGAQGTAESASTPSGAGTSNVAVGTKGDGVVSNQEAAVNAGESRPLAAPGGDGPNATMNGATVTLQNKAGGPNAGVTGEVPQTGKVAGAATSAPGGNSDVAPGAQTDSGAEQSPGGVSGDKTQSPTSNDTDKTELGQTGASNTEKAAAGSPGMSDSKAAEVSSALSGDTAEGQKKFVATCSGCHGPDGKGGIGPALNGDKGPGTWMIEQFQAAVRQGHAPDRELGAVMPRFTTEQLSDEDLTDIYAYLKTLRQ
ncbi:c-type cytochrome [Deinococcus hopiensis]|uniref:Cytochrome c553 n=1 Tax=Deinococcus hopiensis KR-140 TaxID=695939 RepID=A0A1W1VLU2_9DEIO|nr:c-type cytochrome [Deinococcus hopiensis]SMB93914.1 Cytochrome c553 [Deinococcus hopiensis KR-140]